MRPITITADTIPDLRGFFIRELWQYTGRTKIVFAPILTPYVSFTGDGVIRKDDQWILELGSIPSVGETKRKVRLQNSCQTDIRITADGEMDRLAFQWQEEFNGILKGCGGSAEMEFVFSGDQFTTEKLYYTYTILAEASGIEVEYPLAVRAALNKDFPHGDFNFNGKETPGIHDFGTVDPAAIGHGMKTAPAYSFKITNRGDKEFRLELETTVDWLELQLANKKVPQKLLIQMIPPGKDLSVSILPACSLELNGRQMGEIVCRTNDNRKECQVVHLPFQCNYIIDGPYLILTSEEKIWVKNIADNPSTFEIPVMNLGNQPALVTLDNTPGLELIQRTVPVGNSDEKGGTNLKVLVKPDIFAPRHHQLNLSLLVEKGIQPVLTVPVDIDVIKVTHVPEIIDFETINSGQTVLQNIEFSITGNRVLSFQTEPDISLKGNIDVHIDGKVLTATLVDLPIEDGYIKSFDGPGIWVRDLNSGYEKTLTVKFRRTAPVLVIEPGQVDLGEIAAGSVHAVNFRISNTGEGDLSFNILSDDSGVWVPVSDTSGEIKPMEYMDISYLFKCPDSMEVDRTIYHDLEITANDPARKAPQKIPITAIVVRAGGKICINPTCDNPDRIAENLNTLYCPQCGHSMAEAEIVPEKGLKKCQKCERKFSSDILYCPRDGKKLIILS